MRLLPPSKIRPLYIRLIMLSLMLGGGSLAYMYGYMSRARSLPPASLMEGVVRWADSSPTVRKLYYWFRDDLMSSDETVGRFRELRGSNEEGLTPEQQREVEALNALGYVSGYEAAKGFSGVTVHDATRAYEGLNLYTSGHAEAAYLMNMKGEIIHSWEASFREALPEHADLAGSERAHYWRYVHLFEDGGLLAIYDGFGLIRLDHDSRLLWANPIRAHHDLHVAPDGTIHVLTRNARVLPRIHPWQPVLEDFISVLSPDGELLSEFSLLEAVENSPYASILDNAPTAGDIFHTNTLELMDGSLAAWSPLFEAGNALVSFREANTVAIVDLKRQKIAWALSGLWSAQHHPTLLPDGNLLVFDNRGHGRWSKVIELNPLTQEIAWLYGGDEENEFFSRECGLAQRLPNGNTLITESDSGRAFEVTAEKETVWSYYNPARAGKDGEFIATIFEMVRVDPRDHAAWLTTGGKR